MSVFRSLLEEIFDMKIQHGASTMNCNIHLVDSDLCSSISRDSSAGLDKTHVDFEPPLPLEEALFVVRKYTEKGHFTHKS